MPEANDLNPTDPVQQSIKTQLPELEDDLQRAINSLRKLQSITGTLTGDRFESPARLDLRTPLTNNGASNLGAGVPARSILEPRNQSERAPTAQQVRILAAGESFGRYQITRPLGKGAMGAVYLAYDPQLQRYIALKTPFLGNNPQVVQRFYREARSRPRFVAPMYVRFMKLIMSQGFSSSRWPSSKESRLPNGSMGMSRILWTRLSRYFARFLRECRRPMRKESYIGISSRTT